MNTQNYRQEQPYQVMTMGNWFITLLVLGIPIVGFIMLFVWGFGGNEKPSRANFCKLSLLLMIIGVILAIVLSVTGVGVFSRIIDLLPL
ncbi:MAG: hypothetical protein J7L77_04405 [Clostridiales bacterium]|nr:hypothetical protein [Clostridiales bacterium]